MLGGFARTVLARLGRSSTQDVEDALADAYVTAATRIRNDPALQIENMGGWFRRVILLTCLERNRRARREHRSFSMQLQQEDDALDLIAGENPPFELRAALREALDRLPESDRTIVVMAAEGHTSSEIAQALGGTMTAESVRQKKSRVLVTLQKLLGGIQIWAK